MELSAIGSLARNNLGHVLLALGKLDEAWDMELIAIESFVMQGDDRMANGSRVYLSQIHQRKGSLGSAEKEVREALHGTSTVPTVRMQAYAQLLLDVLNKPLDATFVVIQEVELENWGWGGLPVSELRKRRSSA